MYRPAPIREFVTPAIQKRTQVVVVNGRQQKQVTQVANLRGKFKQKGTSEIRANGLFPVVPYRNRYVRDDRL